MQLCVTGSTCWALGHSCSSKKAPEARPTRHFIAGQEVQIEMRLAFGFIGDVQLELIQQVNDAPSPPYTEFLDEGGREGGLQHLGYWGCPITPRP